MWVNGRQWQFRTDATQKNSGKMIIMPVFISKNNVKSSLICSEAKNITSTSLHNRKEESYGMSYPQLHSLLLVA